MLLLLACHASIQSSAPPDESDTPVGDTAADTGGNDDSGSTDTSGRDSTPHIDTAPGDTAPGDTAPVDTSPPTFDECFAGISPVVTYAGTPLVMGSHCAGTNHQDIDGVQRVVFIGDSVTVGSPPTAADDWYRNELAQSLVTYFGLEAPEWEWENVDLLTGQVYTAESGSFACCAKWGARTDDLLLEPHLQIDTCIPEDRRDLTTLVVMTTGGNDLYNLLENIRDGVDPAESQAQWALAISDLQDAVHYLKDDASRFPGGLYLVFANIFDVTDTTAALDIAQCDGAGWIGLDAPLVDPLTAELAVAWQEEVAALATETGSDLVFMGEAFCGHGYNAGDSAGRCYRGPGAELWYDYTCMHPSADGHQAIADMFYATISE